MRTYGAALASALVVGGSLAGLGVFLGFPTAPSLWFGLACGLLAGLLLLGASRRADTFHPTDPNAHLADHAPEPGGRTDLRGVEDPGLEDDDTRSTAHDHPDDPPVGDTRG